MRAGQIGQTNRAERRAATDQDRRAIEQQAIDEIGGDQAGGEPRSPFGQHQIGIGDRRQRCRIEQVADIIAPRIGGTHHRHFGGPILQPGQPHIETRVVGAECPTPDEDQIGPRAFKMGVGARPRPGDPLAFARRQRHRAIERHRELQGDLRPATAQTAEEPRHHRFGLDRSHPGRHRDAGRLQPGNAFAIGARIRVPGGDDDTRYAGGNQRIRTGGPSRADMGTGFERHIGGGTTGGIACLRQRHCFGMGTTTGLGPAATDDAASSDDHAADARVWRRPPDAAFRQCQSGTHPAGISFLHFTGGSTATSGAGALPAAGT